MSSDNKRKTRPHVKAKSKGRRAPNPTLGFCTEGHVLALKHNVRSLYNTELSIHDEGAEDLEARIIKVFEAEHSRTFVVEWEASDKTHTGVLKLYFPPSSKKNQVSGAQMWRKEVTAYERLQGLQGVYVPKFMGTVTFQVRVPADDTTEAHEFTKVPGILLQHINGAPVHKYVKTEGIPPDFDASHFCQLVGEVLHLVNNLGINHCDVHLNNLLVTRTEDTWVPVLIDFADSKSPNDYKDGADDPKESLRDHLQNAHESRWGRIIAKKLNTGNETRWKSPTGYGLSYTELKDMLEVLKIENLPADQLKAFLAAETGDTLHEADHDASGLEQM